MSSSSRSGIRDLGLLAFWAQASGSFALIPRLKVYPFPCSPRQMPLLKTYTCSPAYDWVQGCLQFFLLWRATVSLRACACVEFGRSETGLNVPGGSVGIKVESNKRELGFGIQVTASLLRRRLHVSVSNMEAGIFTDIIQNFSLPCLVVVKRYCTPELCSD